MQSLLDPKRITFALAIGALTVAAGANPLQAQERSCDYGEILGFMSTNTLFAAENCSLIGADFNNRSAVQGSSFYNSNLSLAKFASGYLYGVDFFGATLIFADFTDAWLRLANFRSTTMTGAFLAEANLIGADFNGATLDRADFREAVGGRFDANNITDFTLARLSYARFEQASMRRAIFDDARAGNANMTQTILEYASMQRLNAPDLIAPRANFRYANLRSAVLTDANLRWTDLRGANMESANLEGADLLGANIAGMKYKSARLSGARWVNGIICRPGSVGVCLY